MQIRSVIKKDFHLLLIDAKFARKSAAIVKGLDVGGDVAAVREFLLAEFAREFASSVDGGLVSLEGGSVGEVLVAFGAREATTAVNRLHVQFEGVNVSEAPIANAAHQFLEEERGVGKVERVGVGKEGENRYKAEPTERKACKASVKGCDFKWAAA